jgi:hypothetical protein
LQKLVEAHTERTLKLVDLYQGIVEEIVADDLRN